MEVNSISKFTLLMYGDLISRGGIISSTIDYKIVLMVT